MKAESAGPPVGAFTARRDAIAQEWLARTLRTYPEHAAHFLGLERDRFRNPVGHTLREALPALLNELLGGMEPSRVMSLLDGVVRIRAVQDFTAAQAVAFLFLLKKIVRETLGGDAQRGAAVEALAALEGRIDEMALLAFDLFMKCRERIYEIRADEARRRVYLLARMAGTQPAGAGPSRAGGAGMRGATP